uniref:T2-type RNase n=1 Tax=Solanum tuberosum TaxID=4113 RepID=M1CTX8_SOLTU
MLFVCCILIAVKGGWDEEVGLLRRGGEQREFDYFKLALQWPGTYCRKTRHCCSSNACCTRSNSPSVFTIHGLWTEYNDGTWPSCCSGRPFDEKEISTLLEPMRKYWPSLSCGSPRSCHHKKGPFWGHENVFKAVGDFCGGWVKTEEETDLRNHLKWARILVKANGNSIPKEVKIAFEGIEYIIQVWDETPTRFFAGESACDIGGDRRTQSSNQWLLQKGETSKSTPLPAGDRNFHVGSTKDFESINRARDIKQLKGKELGLDPLAQQDCNLNEKQVNISDWTSEPLLDEIQANYRNLVAPDKEGDPVHLFHGDRDENFEFLADIRDDDDMSIIHTEERTTTETQTGNNMLLEHKGDGEGIIEDIIPLNSEEQDIGIAAENEIPSWIQQNIIRLSKEFGVQFIGCEEAALNLFMKIDGKREAIEKMAGAIVPTTPTEKIPRELKNLEPASNFVSYGTRSRGGCFINVLNES